MPVPNSTSITAEREISEILQILKNRMSIHGVSKVLKLLLLESETFKEFCPMEYEFLIKYHSEDLKNVIQSAERRLYKFEKMTEENEVKQEEVEEPTETNEEKKEVSEETTEEKSE